MSTGPFADLSPAQRRQIREAFANARRETRISRRHPAEVTSDRLGDASSRWGDQFTPEELDMIAAIRYRLEQIAEGER